jgi:hypothetical protein
VSTHTTSLRRAPGAGKLRAAPSTPRPYAGERPYFRDLFASDILEVALRTEHFPCTVLSAEQHV